MIKKNIFLSLKWKTLVVICVIFTCAVASIGHTIYTEGTRLFEEQLAESIRNNSSALLDQHRRSLIEIGTSVSLAGRNTEANISEESLRHYLDNNWDLMELEWGLESLFIYDIATQSTLTWGRESDIDFDKMLKRDVTKGPSTTTLCTEFCTIYAKIPLYFMNGKKKYLFIGTGLVDFIINFAQKNHLKAALLRKSSQINHTSSSFESLPHWHVQIAGMTEKEAYFPIIEQLANVSTFETVKQNGKTIHHTPDDQYYYLYAIPLLDNVNHSKNSEFILLANNISHEKARIYDTMAYSGLITLIGLICAIFIVFYVLNSPMKRLQQQAKLLPLLAKKQFEYVRTSIRHHQRFQYTRNELDVLEDTAIKLSSELEVLYDEIEQRTGELEKMALFDVLTGLANRRMFIEQLKGLIENARKHRERFAIVFIDLDNFKRINDTLGHDIGDELLIEVSKRLKSAVRDTDTVARLGGDEFTLLLPQIKSLDHAKVALDKVLEKFQIPVILNKNDYKITPSIGAAIGPDNGMETDELMRCADVAMYKSKKNGKNCYCFFTNEMNSALQEEVKLEAELLDAVNNKEFRLFYQPIIELKTGKIAGFEGLIRWNHAEKGLIGPGQFINTLETNGQIIPLGEQIIELACLDRHYLNSLGMSDAWISINISAKQFNDPLLVDKFQTLLKKYKLKPTSFQIEITEQTLISDIDKQAKQLNILQKLGFKIAIDDFGTGYSSLAYLKKLPLDTLKIDQSFLKEIPNNRNDIEIVSAITAMAKNLSLTVTAEGVETQQQEAFLKEIGCDFSQGFLYSKPQPLELINQSL